MKKSRCYRDEIMWGFIEMVENGGKHYGSHYFYPTLKTSVGLLWEIQGIKTSVRTLCRAIREGVDQGLIWRKNRHIRGQGLKMVCRSTIYRVCDKAKSLMKKVMLRARRFLTPLGVPFLAQDKVTPARHLFSAGGFTSDWMAFKEKDGSAMVYNRLTGEVKPR